MKLFDPLLRDDLMAFLEEDVGLGDITTEAIVPAKVKAGAQIIVKEPAVVAGILEAKVFFENIGITVVSSLEDGDEVGSGTIIMEVKGNARAILTAERTILNILMRMSGIATTTRRLVKKICDAGFHTHIAATRKTAPGLRYFDKRAVFVGGGDTHRLRLDDAVLIKDNHIAIAGGIQNTIEKVRSTVSFSKKIEIEARTPEQALEAAKSGADIIMLDNMTLQKAKKTMKTLKESNLGNGPLIEISGGINEENILQYAELQPDIISLGYLTHSAKAIDMSLEVV